MDGNLIRGVHHICMKVADIGAAVDFYTKEMGYSVRIRWDGGALLRSPDGTHLEFFPVDEEKGYAHVAYVCTDVDKAFARMVGSGCAPVVEPKDAQLPCEPPLPIRIAFIRDPAGQLIELFHECGPRK
jgi:glyoxylase I family protein